MSDAINAVNSAKNLAKQYRAVLDLVEYVNSIGNIEEHIAALKREENSIKASVEKVREQEAKAKQRCKTANDEAAEAESEAAEAKQDAEKQAEDILSKARQEANRILSVAKDSAKSTQAKIDKDLKDHEKWMAAANKEREQLESRLTDLNTQLDKLRQRLS